MDLDARTAPLRAAIRDVPDFPKPGIVFKDITTLLKDPKLFRQTVDLTSGIQARSLDVSITRHLPRWDLIAVIRFDEVDDEQSFAMVLVPHGINAARFSDPYGILRPRD